MIFVLTTNYLTRKDFCYKKLRKQDTIPTICDLFSENLCFLFLEQSGTSSLFTITGIQFPEKILKLNYSKRMFLHEITPINCVLVDNQKLLSH